MSSPHLIKKMDSKPLPPATTSILGQPPREEVVISRTLVNNLLHHAQSSPDKEICGLIAIRGDTLTSSYPVKNGSPSPEIRFEMDPREQLQTMKTMRGKNEKMFAIYHSHPKSAALPSKTDLKEAAYPDVLHIIISLNTKGVLEMRGFRVSNDKQIREVTLLLES